MERIILSPIPLEELRQLLQQVVREEISKKQNEDLQEKLLTPEETCKLFSPSITRQTLYNWTKKGVLVQHDYGRRGYYKYTEVLQAAKTLKRYRRI